MRPRKSATGKGRSAAASAERERPSLDSSGFERDRPTVHHRTSVPPVGSLLDDRNGYPADDGHRWFSDELIEDHNNINGGIGGGGGASNPRSFPYSVKQQCWEKAEKVKGRDPDRWRRDPLGNIIFRKLVGCPGCLCHDYDHIVPYSKGGKSTLENCQVLQSTYMPGNFNFAIAFPVVMSKATVNRFKGNKTEISKSDLIQKSAYCRVSGRDLDLVELSAYGNVRRAQDSGGCNIQ